MFKKIEEIPIHNIINSGLYKLALPFFLGQSTPSDEEEKGFPVYHFPVEAYIRRDEDLDKGIFARFVVYDDEKRAAGDWYFYLATILRKAYFTTLFNPDVPERIKWIEHRTKSGLYETQILEVELEWEKSDQCYRFVSQKKLNSIFD